MESHFEINVSVDGSHYFATAPRSFTNLTERGLKEVRDAAKAIRNGLTIALPGKLVEVSITRWEGSGRQVKA